MFAWAVFFSTYMKTVNFVCILAHISKSWEGLCFASSSGFCNPASEECIRSSAFILGSGFLAVALLNWAFKSTENEQKESPEEACLE